MDRKAPEVARLDRKAAMLGVQLKAEGARRTFSYRDREITYRLQGKGAFRIEAWVNGELEAVTVCGEPRIELLLLKASQE